ncbi:cyclase family protein [Legionella maceachernii]|uniref:cyclase family protein n=1 Tax=Legionella maceachernii TaxID=466 RepID=UPI0022772DF3|nr:cyclase family protein [Legionella maceachernii]
MWDYDACDTDVKFSCSNHSNGSRMGTHIDAPAHCVASGKTIEDLSLDSLLSPCIMIDVSKHMHENYQFTAKDIKVFEREFGQIEEQSFC